MIFVGIDPGITGGIAAVDHEGAIMLRAPMPTMPSNIATLPPISRWPRGG